MIFHVWRYCKDLTFKHRPVSSVGRALLCWTEGREFRARSDHQPKSLKNWWDRASCETSFSVQMIASLGGDFLKRNVQNWKAREVNSGQSGCDELSSGTNLKCLFCKDVQFSLNVLGRKKKYEIEISLKSREFSVLNKGVLKRFWRHFILCVVVYRL